MVECKIYDLKFPNLWTSHPNQRKYISRSQISITFFTFFILRPSWLEIANTVPALSEATTLYLTLLSIPSRLQLLVTTPPRSLPPLSLLGSPHIHQPVQW